MEQDGSYWHAENLSCITPTIRFTLETKSLYFLLYTQGNCAPFYKPFSPSVEWIQLFVFSNNNNNTNKPGFVWVDSRYSQGKRKSHWNSKGLFSYDKSFSS